MKTHVDNQFSLSLAAMRKKNLFPVAKINKMKEECVNSVCATLSFHFFFLNILDGIAT